MWCCPWSDLPEVVALPQAPPKIDEEPAVRVIDVGDGAGADPADGVPDIDLCGDGCAQTRTVHLCSPPFHTELTGEAGGADVAALAEGEVAADGAGILQAGEFADIADGQQLPPAGKGKDLLKVVTVIGSFRHENASFLLWGVVVIAGGGLRCDFG